MLAHRAQEALVAVGCLAVLVLHGRAQRATDDARRAHELLKAMEEGAEWRHVHRALVRLAFVDELDAQLLPSHGGLRSQLLDGAPQALEVAVQAGHS